MSPETITAIFIVSIIAGAMTGYPIALILGGISLIIGYFTLGITVFTLMYMRSINLLLNYNLLAIPLFIFMGYILGESGIANNLYESLYQFFSRAKGGLAAATILIGAILAACVGVIGASIAMLAVIALPSMLGKGYNKSLACGAVCAGGTLGILIPPSVMLVIYGPMAKVSVGKLFLGAFPPGFLLAFLYMIYILIHSSINTKLGPSAVESEVDSISFTRKLKLLIISLIPPAFLVLTVLGVIYFGIAAPTEAAAIGCGGAVILSILFKKFNMDMLKKSLLGTLEVTSFIMFVGVFASAIVGIFLRLGCGEVISNFILSTPGGKWGAFALIMVVVFILGMFIDWVGIIFIMVPIITPIADELGFNPVWFSIIICINLQMSFLTPPFAPAIFYLRGMVTKDMGINTNTIIKGVLPFIVIIVSLIILCVFFPNIILWLPNSMVRTGW